jgi:hypothetical protein
MLVTVGPRRLFTRVYERRILGSRARKRAGASCPGPRNTFGWSSRRRCTATRLPDEPLVTHAAVDLLSGGLFQHGDAQAAVHRVSPAVALGDDPVGSATTVHPVGAEAAVEGVVAVVAVERVVALPAVDRTFLGPLIAAAAADGGDGVRSRSGGRIVVTLSMGEYSRGCRNLLVRRCLRPSCS